MSVTKLRLFKNGVEIPFPPGSDRGIQFSKEFIPEASQFARLVDGTLVYTGDPAFGSYAIEIQCSDQKVPAIGQVRHGDVLTVHWGDVDIEPGPAVTLSREPVPGSVRAYDAQGRVIAQPEGQTLNVPGAAYFEYRPMLSVMVTGISFSGRELAAARDWTLTAEEDGSAPAVVAPPSLPDGLVEATGGVVTDYVDEDGAKWREHDFTASGTFSVTAPGEVEYEIAAGAGGGGWAGGGGGGAGGYISGRKRIDALDYPIIIGAGGPSGNDSTYAARPGRRGSASSALGLTAVGGGGGAGSVEDTQYCDGASAGGAAWRNSNGGSVLGNAQAQSNVIGQGYPGGTAIRLDGFPARGAGGGGAAGPGVAVADAVSPLNGGAGVIVTFSGGELELAGGGAGYPEGTGTHGGGSIVDGSGENGQQNSGGGGGGAGGTGRVAGNGGSGRIIIRYRIA